MTTITRSLARHRRRRAASPRRPSPGRRSSVIPFEIEGGKLIAWGSGPGWNTPDRSYDIKKLVADTTAVLTPDAPVLTRMENMRRATIYAMRDPVIAHELLKTRDGARARHHHRRPRVVRRRLPDRVVQAGASTCATTRKPELRAWAAVDETIRVDGYDWVKKAMAMTGAERGDGIRRVADDAGRRGGRASRQGRRRRAEGSLVARNLAAARVLNS